MVHSRERDRIEDFVCKERNDDDGNRRRIDETNEITFDDSSLKGVFSLIKSEGHLSVSMTQSILSSSKGSNSK